MALVPQGGTGSMLPPPPRQPAKRKQEVLDEDEWTSKIEAIIERDFFPELARLQSKVEWLEALRSGDPQQIRQAQLNIAARRARSGNATPGAPLFTPGGTAARLAPGTTPFFMPGATPAGAGGRLATIPEKRAGQAAGAGAGAGPSTTGAAGEGGPTPGVSLDTFLAAHTSEDNASFGELLEDTNKKRRLRRAAAAVHQNPALLLLGSRQGGGGGGRGGGQQLLLTDGSGGDEAGRERTDGFGTSGQQPDTLMTWRHEPMNALFYDSSTRDVVPYTERELADMVQGPPKQIMHRNTRFPKPEDSRPPSAAATPNIHSAQAGATRPAGVAQRGPAAAAAGGTTGYDILATPSFDPGVDGTPFMTWGDIEATPLRIDAEDLPPGPLSDAGAKFRVPDMPAKEARGHALAAKAATSLRKRAAAGALRPGSTPLLGGSAAARRRGATPAAAPGSSRPPTQLSDAAKRLASSLGRDKSSGGADAQLRRSYVGGGGGRRPVTGTGAGSSWSSAAPTPSRGWTPAGTPSVHATLEEEELRLKALMKLKEKEAKERAELDAARTAALSSFKSQHQQQQQRPGSRGGSQAAAPGEGTTANLTDGLLNI